MNKSKLAFWVYWIPIENVTDSNRPDWLEIICEPFSALGALHGHSVLSHAQLDRQLAAGILNIGLRDISDLEKVLEVSRVSTRAMLKLIRLS